MEKPNGKIDAKSIQSVELNLINGQVDIILRSLELYGCNLEFMLDDNNSDDSIREEKIALLKYTYEQILATQAEQVNSKSNNFDSVSSLGKKLLKDSKESNVANLKIV